MTAIRYSLFSIAAVLFSFASACQQSNLPEYKAYASDHDVPRMTVEEAKKDYDAGIAVIVDSRPETTYQQERIAGSINIPGTLSDDQAAKLPKGKKIIVYCS